MINLRSYRKPRVFDSVKKALNPKTNFTQGLYGHGVGRSSGIFSRNAANPARRAREDDREYRVRQAKIHALRGVVIGGNIVTLGLVNLIFAVQNAAIKHKKGKAAQKEEIQTAVRAVVQQSAGNFGLERFQQDLVEMVNYRLGFGPAPAIWANGKRLANKGANIRGIGSERNAYEFYHGYIIFERHVADVLKRFY